MSPGLVPRLLDIQRRAQQSWDHIPPTVHHSSSTKRFFWSEILCRLQSCTTKTSFASHCKSLEIRLLDSQLKGRKWGNVCSTEIFSNTPTIKEVSFTEIDSFSWLNVHAGLELPYGEHWSVFSQMVCLQHRCGNHSWTVSERISVKPNEKKCWIGSSHIGSNLISFPDLLWTKPKARSVKVRKFVFLDWLLHLTPAQSPLWKLTRQTFFKLKF